MARAGGSLSLAAVVLGLSVAPAAGAPYVPDGRSGIDEYVLTLPYAGGDRHAPAPGAPADGHGSPAADADALTGLLADPALGPGAARRLRTDGRGGAPTGHGTSDVPTQRPVALETGGGPAGALFASGGGLPLGALVPAVVAALAMAGAGVLRRRLGTPS